MTTQSQLSDCARSNRTMYSVHRSIQNEIDPPLLFVIKPDKYLFSFFEFWKQFLNVFNVALNTTSILNKMPIQETFI